MAIIDRLKKRFETDLDDAELQLVIDEANQEVIRRFGPHADPSDPITVELDGYRKKVVLDRPIDTTETIVVTEYDRWTWSAPAFIVLDPTDYFVWPGGSIVERLATGANSRSHWGYRVEIEYTPANDGDQREEVIIKLVILSLQYTGAYAGLGSKRVGDVVSSEADYQDAREKLLASLSPRPGLYMA